MKKLFKPELSKTLLFIFVILLFMKIVWFGVEMLFLPAMGSNYVQSKNIKGLYYRVKLVNEKPPVKKHVKRHVKKVRKKGGNIKDITLIAIYNSSDLIIVTVEYKKKSKVLSKGDLINGFMLESVGNNFAIFSKNAKTYQIFLTKINTKGIVTSEAIGKKSVDSKVKKTVKSGKIEKVGDRRIVDRSLVEHYAKNMKEIFKDIGIVEAKKSGVVIGFRITFVRRGSKFAQLGLRRGDVLTSINGQMLDNYGAALGIYKNIDTLENLTLVIKRGKEEMELEYEIN